MKQPPILSAVLLVVFWPLLAAAQQSTPATDACAGLGAYEDAILDAGSPFGRFLQEERINERDSVTFSAPEWIALAGQFETLQSAFKAIDPPPAVVAWHEAVIDQLGYQSTLARTAARDGLIAAAALTDSDAAREIRPRLQTAIDDATAACPGFADVYETWDAIDGDPAPASPAATPSG